MNRIQFLLIEQDYGLRYKNGMTVTDRRKADCWTLGRNYGLHTQEGRATKQKVRKALEELVWTMFANFDDYSPAHITKELFSEDEIAALKADALDERERVAHEASA